ncbi:MAG: ERF family protein [Usitatibacter sp.]
MTTATAPLIYAALAACMKDIGVEGIAKDRENKQQNFKFRGIDQVYNALNPILSKHGVVFVPNFTERIVDTRRNKDNTSNLYNVTVRGIIRAYASDGSYVEGATYGEAMDSADKATNKAESAAYKYFAFQLFCIPTEETAQDSDADPKHETTRSVNAEELTALRQSFAELGIDEKLFCKSIKVDALGDLLVTDLPEVDKLLAKKRKKLAEKPAANDAQQQGAA